MSHERQSNRLERQKLPPNPDMLINALVGHPCYLELSSRGISHAETISTISQLEFDRNPDGPYALPLQLLAITPKLEAAQAKFRDLHEQNAPNHEIRQLKRDELIPINHQLRNIFDHNPRLPVEEFLQFVEGSTLSISGPEAARQTRIDVDRVLQGMRHELAFESLLYHLSDSGVSYDESDKSASQLVDEDLHGIDMVIEYKGKPIAIDIKASQKRADEANLKSHPSDTKIILWSQFRRHDLGDKLRPDYVPAMIEEKSGKLLNELEKAYQAGIFYRPPKSKRNHNIGVKAVSASHQS